ncbi:MAG TPA: hypothetical protein VFM39_06930 [bacterium]|nr:hypothetical protein [bacterium]
MMKLRLGWRLLGMAAVVGVLAWDIGVAATPAPAPRTQPIVRADDLFPYGVYIAGGTWYDHEWAAGNGKFRSVAAYLDNVTASMQAGGFNVVWPNAMAVEAPEYEKVLRTWIAAARPRGIRVLPQGGPFPGGSDEIYRGVKNWPALVDGEIKPFYRTVVPKFRDDRTLLAWSIGEEPPAEERDRPIYEAIRSVTDVVTALDPHHPAIFLYHWPEGVEMAARIVRPKIMPSNIGPFQGTPGLATWTENTIYYSVDIERRFRASRSIGVPLWVMGTASEVDEYKNGRLVTDRRRPTPNEIRWQVWAALFHGARGFFYFVYRDLDPAPIPNGEYIIGMVDSRGMPNEMYHAAVRAGQETRPLWPLLIRLEAGALAYEYPPDPFGYDEQVESYWERLPRVRWRSFTHRDTRARYWMAVNFDLERAQTPVQVPETARLRDVGSGVIYTPATLSTLFLAPGSGALFEDLSR